MKAKKFLILLTSLILASCDGIISNSFESESISNELSESISNSSSETISESNEISSNTNIISSSNEQISSSEESSSSIEESSSEESSSSIEESSSEEENSSVEEPSNSNISSSEEEKELKQISFSDEIDTGKYEDNYGSAYINGNFFEYYKACSVSHSLIKLKHAKSNFNISNMPGMFYNTSPLYGIRRVNISYMTHNSTSGFVFKYGIDNLVNNSISIPISNNDVSEYSFEIPTSNFFKIETVDADVTIEKIDLYYEDEINGYVYKKDNYATSYNRLNPIVYTGELLDGVSYVDAPIEVKYSDNTYEVLKTKRYTYYSYDYICNNKELASSAVYTSPIDVANYFIAFKTYPANYVFKKQYYNAYNIFKDDTRCVSSYTRTDGYATALPYSNYLYGEPLYYECDIALTSSYSSKNRGVGRVVVWIAGFSNDKGAINYDSSPVAVYTDDHYASFCEYLNDGTFSTNFDAEMDCTNYKWCNVKTFN